MNRITDDLKAVVATVPVSLASATDSTAVYLDSKPYSQVAFVIQHGAMTSGKKITVKLYHADDAAGTNATKLKEQDFTFLADVTSGVISVSKEISALDKPFLGVVFQHDKGSAVVVSAAMLGAPKYVPVDGSVLNA